MDQRAPPRPYDRPSGEQHQMLYQHHAPPYQGHTAQPPAQIPFSDPFPQTRDPFLPANHARRESNGFGGRAWGPNTNGSGIAAHSSPPQNPSQQTRLPPPPYVLDQGQAHMSFDPSRRRSLGGIGSPPQHHDGAPSVPGRNDATTADHNTDPREPQTMPSTFSSRNMPPPSSPQIPPYSSNPTMPGTAPRGPPTVSPFAGIRDLASMSSHHRSNGGMSISAILEDTRKPANSPHLSNAFASPSQNLMRPPSPGRARASSMREGYARQMRPMSPGRINAFGDQRPASAVLDQERFAPEAMRDGMFRSPHLPRESAHSFRAFRAPPERSPISNGVRAPMRPSSQPIEPGPTRPLDEILKRDDTVGGRLGVFRAFGDGIQKPRSEAPGSRDGPSPYRHSGAPTSQPVNGMVSRSPQSAREEQQQRQLPAEPQPGLFGRPMREDQAGLFRPTYQPQQPNALEQARESIEARVQYEPRPDHPHSSPPMSDIGMFGPPRNGYYERPLTYEEHQQIEARNREMEQRKSSDGAMHRALMNISPELSRRGRNSPLPQAVQGAQPRPSGAGIKSEFGRMFSGLGSGVGSATPVAGQSANGTTTPSRQSPMAQVDEADLAAGDRQNGSAMSKLARISKANGRRSREESRIRDSEAFDGRMTPSLSQRGNKRSKTAHHHHHHGHHHHHHHHDAAEVQPTAVNPLRFASETVPHSTSTPNSAHHHHHHHGAHAHPGHHHHHAAKTVPIPRKPTTTIESQQLIDSVSSKPRKYLGSHLYEAEVSEPHVYSPSSSQLPYTNTMVPIPKFSDRENCTLTVRVPRWYLTRSATEIEANEPSRLEIISRRRQLWGSDVYTDDSDVVAAAIHSGWLRGDFGDLAEDLHDLCDSEQEGAASSTAITPLSYPTKPPHPVTPPSDYDAHITLLILPPLENYTGTTQHHLRSRTWKGTPHDGMSFAVLGLEFVDEGPAGRGFGRGGKGRKERFRRERERRVEAAGILAGLGGRR